jgi:hypothetical protein
MARSMLFCQSNAVAGGEIPGKAKGKQQPAEPAGHKKKGERR